MSLGLVKRIFGEGASANGYENQHVDLTEWSGDAPQDPESADTVVRVAEINRYEDLRDYQGYVYDGDILVLDIAPIEDNELVLKRVTTDLKEAAADVGGDVAGIGDNLLMVTPGGTQVARKKLRGGE